MKVSMTVVALALGLSGIAHAGPAWHGRKITMDLQEAEIGNVLRLIADVSHKNIVFGDEVKGKVTIKLKDVPWDQAFDTILKTKGLGSEEDGDIIRVAPQSVLDTEEQKRLDLDEQQALKGRLVTRIVPVSYATAQEMAPKVQKLLSARGTVVVDERTNTLIIRDVRSSAALR